MPRAVSLVAACASMKFIRRKRLSSSRRKDTSIGCIVRAVNYIVCSLAMSTIARGSAFDKMTAIA